MNAEDDGCWMKANCDGGDDVNESQKQASKILLYSIPFPLSMFFFAPPVLPIKKMK